MAKGKKANNKARAEDSDDSSITLTTRPEWRKPGMSREQNKYCANVVKAMKQHQHSGPFLEPVDPVKLNVPDYADIIKHPMDIGTVDRKLNNCEYESVAAFVDDVRLIFSNCYLYNGRDAIVSKYARELEILFTKQMSKMPGSEQGSKTVEASSSKASSSKASTSKPPAKPQPVAEPTKTSEAKRPKREIRPPPSKDLPDTPAVRRPKLSRSKDAELKFCRNIIKELRKKQYMSFAYPFYEPVDAVKLQVPDYYDVIKHPMDISTLSRKLDNDMYNSAEEFETDVRLIFRNCYMYNPAGSEVYRMGKQLETVFDKKWSEKPVPQKVVSPEPPNEDESSSDDADEQAQHLKDLQKHLTILQSQIASIQKVVPKAKPRRSSKATPPKGPSRKNSVKSGTKEARKPSAKQARKAEDPAEPLTAEQQTDLSERINHLDEDKMTALIELIKQSGAPMEADDGTYELSLESIDARTARKIYEFVLKHTSAPRKPPAKKQRMAYSAEEQQRQITALEQQLQKFEKVNGSASAVSPTPQSQPMDVDSSSGSSESSSESDSEDSGSDTV